MALYRVGLSVLGVLMLAAGCNSQNQAGQTAARPVVEVSPDTKAIADVDRRATLALKQNLLTQFPQNSPSAAVEKGLVEDGFDCSVNPAAPTERACLKAVRENNCEVNTIIRTTPYAPEKAQVIKICEVATDAPTP